MAIKGELGSKLEATPGFGVVQLGVSPAKIQVLGLGYIGLPTSLMFAGAGFEVVGVDLNPTTVDLLNSGKTHLSEKGLDAKFEDVRRGSNFRATTTPEGADVFIIAVPTPDRGAEGADLSFVRAASESIARVIRHGNMVVLESTVPPGTCVDVIAPIIEQVAGLQHGKDYDLVHCPERVIPGSILKELVENKRVIGGTTLAAAERARELYASFVQGEILLTDATTAELVKVMENTYRDVNIALANEFKAIAETVGADAYEAIRLANLHPRVEIHQPGIGVGGHCIPVDPWFLVAAAPDKARLIRVARDINSARPHQVAEEIMAAADSLQASSIAFLGLAYKPDVDDFRESPALEIVQLVASKFRGSCRVVEPFAESLPDGLAKLPNVQIATLESALEESEMIVTLVRHQAFVKRGAPDCNPCRVLDFARVWPSGEGR